MIRTLTPIFSIIVAVIVFFFVIQPTVAKIKVVDAETAQYEDAVEKATQLNQKLDALLAKKNANTPESLGRLTDLVPFELDEVRMLVDLKQMAVMHNMLFGNVEVEKLKAPSANTMDAESTQNISKDSFTTADISFGLIGTYSDFKSFMRDLEQNRILTETIKIAHTATEGDLQQFDVTIRLYALSTDQ